MGIVAGAVTTQWPQSVLLRDGREIFIRPIEPGDKDKLVLGFERLSAESRQRRFLMPVTRLSPSLLRYLTEIDHTDHEALVAESAAGAEPVGVARYIRLADEPESAEVAVTVVDDWQRAGVATALLRRLAARAMDEGVERFVATCLATNTDVLDMLEDLGPQRVEELEDGLVAIEVALPCGEDGPLHAALRRVASGAMVFRHPVERVRGREP
ncbi:MAG: N-acetyltransferase family protein [Solirubrobacteraceae bacterium]